jgi:DNA repair photolyase
MPPELILQEIRCKSALVKQLKSSRSQPTGTVLLGSVTDAYQPPEAVYKITRASLKILAAYGLLEVHILTKSALVLKKPTSRQSSRGLTGPVGSEAVTLTLYS